MAGIKEGLISKMSAMTLSEDDMQTMDDQDFMAEIRSLSKKKAEVLRAIELKKEEMRNWQTILNANTMDEVEAAASEMTTVKRITPEQHQSLQTYQKLLQELNARACVDCVHASINENDELLLKYTNPPDCFAKMKYLILLSAPNEGKRSVLQHNLPDEIPIDTIAKKCLDKEVGPGCVDERLKEFSAFIARYTQPFYKRSEQVMCLLKLQNQEIMDMNVYHNSAITLINVMFSVKEVVSKNSCVYNLTLKYNPLEILPSDVNLEHYKGEKLSENRYAYLKRLTERDIYHKKLNMVFIALIDGLDLIHQDSGTEHSLDTFRLEDDDDDDDVF